MDLVFEIGCEDLPARFVGLLLEQLEANFRALCAEHRIEAGEVSVVGTPRRLALLVHGLADHQADLEEVRTGPPAAVGFKDGQPTKAAEGFARGQGKGVEDLYTLATDRGEYVAVRVFEKGDAVEELLPGLLESLLSRFSFPKSMRWGALSVQFARPVRWIVAVVEDGGVVPVRFANVASGQHTFGHRFMPAPGHGEAPSRLLVTGPTQYLQILAKAGVVVDPTERRAQIVKLVSETAAEVDATTVNDPGLVEEVTNLVEQPHAVLVTYDEAYLDLPDEVLISSMRSHQRYFAVLGDDGKLINHCVVIYNTPVKDDAVVAAGNLRVLKARLDDAKFFWDNDLSRSLESYREDLGTVLWLKQLGSLRDRSDRMSELAGRIASKMSLGDDVVAVAKRAGYLAKADLVTSLVYEFPDLQGVMGREYALRAGEGEAIARAIYEQYLPRGAEDELPSTDAGAAVALAEKLDALVGAFLVGLIPTSTADPYGLRRAALGAIRVLQERGWSVSLDSLVTIAAEVYAEAGVEATWSDQTKTQLLDFIGGRLENQLASDFPTDVVRAVLAVGLDDVTSVTERVAALSALRDEPVFEPLAAGFKRVVNILRKQASEYASETLVVDVQRFQDDAERALYRAANDADSALEEYMVQRDWNGAVGELAKLREPVDAFFDSVMVMVDDPELKKNRIALLFELEALFKRVADLSVIG